MTPSFSAAFAPSFEAQPPAAPLPPFADSDRYLAGQPAGAVPPGNLDDLLADASAQIRRYCGWHIAPVVTETVLIDGSGSYSQRLPTLRLVDVLAVNNGGTDLDVTVLQWSADGYMRLDPCRCWTSMLRGVSATYAHGFDLADVGVLAALVCTLVSRTTSAPHGYVTGETAGGTSVSYGGSSDDRSGSMTLLGYEQALLDSYRLPGRRSA